MIIVKRGLFHHVDCPNGYGAVAVLGVVWLIDNVIYHKNCWNCACHGDIMDGILKPTRATAIKLVCADCGESFAWNNFLLTAIRRHDRFYELPT
jgi:hypothetical protein